MSHEPLRRLAFRLVLLGAAIPALAKPVIIYPADLPEATRAQFANLTAEAHNDPTMLKTIATTQRLFNEAVVDPNRLPPKTEFSPSDVQLVGKQIHDLTGAVYTYKVGQLQVMALYQEGRSDDARALDSRLKSDLGTTQAALNFIPKDQHRPAPSRQTETETATPYASPPALPTASTSGDGDLPKSDAHNLTGPPHPEQTADASATLLCKLVEDVVSKAQPPKPDTTPAAPPSNPAAPAPTPAPTPLPMPGTGGTPNSPYAGPSGGITPVRDVLGVTNPSSPADAMINARERYQGGDIAGGLADASRAIQLGGGAPALAMRGGMELDQKDYPHASADASKALEIDPNNREAVAVSHLARVSGPSVALPGGPAGSNDRPESVPGSSAASAAMAAAAAARASHMSGEQAKKEAQNSMKLGDLDGALVYVSRALSQNPSNPDLLNMRAAIEARKHDYESSIADAKAGLALAPNNKTLLKTLGYSQLRGKYFKDAKETASAMLAVDPANPYAFALRAHAEGNMGDRDAMMADINHAAALDPRYAATAADLAKLVELPNDQDTLFLFPGEVAPSAKTAPAVPSRGRKFGLLVGAAVLGGLLTALGLLRTVMAPLTERITSAFTRRSGAAAVATEDASAASVNGLVPGLIRGQYEVSRQIGAGGMGMVFAGTDRALGRPVAIKKMREELRVNPQERARFVIEAKTVAALHHPNIVDIYAIAEDGADVYLIFEYVDGKTAHELVQTAGRLSIREAARVVRSAADALDYAHARGVIHRDMKPSNVMIDSTGRVKVMDFGIARMAKDSMTRYSMTNTVVGTPPYMAPEQEQGHVRRESDVYALAVCAYEMLTGKLPFIGIGAGMLMNKINMSYVGPSRATAGMPEALDEVFAKAFQADPDKRYRTPKEFADALESALPSTVRA